MTETRKPRHSRARHIALLVLGWVLVVVGVAGLFLPVLQGLLFLALGLLVLSRHSDWVRERVERLRERHPKLDDALEKASDKLHQWRSALKRHKDARHGGGEPHGETGDAPRAR